MNTLEAWILSVLLHIAPSDATRLKSETAEELEARYRRVAVDMATVVKDSKPLFSNDDNRTATASMLLSIAQFESGGFAKRVDEGSKLGDHGKSFCLMQINTGPFPIAWGPDTIRGWTGPDLINDRQKCFKAGLEALRISMGHCGKKDKGQAPSSRLNLYVKGNGMGVDCTQNKHADHRWDYARYLRKKFPLTEQKEVGTAKAVN